MTEADLEKLYARILQLEAQVFKMAEWFLTEKAIAQEGVDDPGMMGEAFRERVATIDSLLDGSAGESKLCDLTAQRDILLRAVRYALTSLSQTSTYEVPPTVIRDVAENLQRANQEANLP